MKVFRAIDLQQEWRGFSLRRLPLPEKGISFNPAYLAAGFMLIDIALLCLAFIVSYRATIGLDSKSALVWKATDGIFCVSLLYTTLASGGYAVNEANNLVHYVTRVLVNGTFIILGEWAALSAFGADTKFNWPWHGPINIVSIGALCMCLSRLAVLRLLSAAAEANVISRNVAIIGTGRQAEQLLLAINAHREPWTKIIGCFDDRKAKRPDDSQELTSSGNLDDLINYAQLMPVDDILVALPWGAEARLKSIFDKLRVIPANVRLAPDSIGHAFLAMGFEKTDGVPLYTIYSKPIGGWSALAKRAEDIFLGTMLLFLASPIMLVAAAAIKLDSPGPIFFHQKRYGYNNQPISVTKFRSLFHQMCDERAERLVTTDDPRVTRVGRILRRLSVDELPQLFDVLRGTMSLIGPRPHALQAKAAGRLYQDIVREYVIRHKVKPGITGWAQVMGWRGETDTEEKILQRVNCDLFYIENWSFFLDVEILVRTFGAIIGKNAY